MQTRFLTFPITWPISRIRRHSRPAYLNDIEAQELQGADHSCDILEDQLICHIPECFDICAGTELEVGITAQVYLQDRFFSYVPTGTLIFGGNGTFDTSRRFSTNGIIELSGSAISLKSDHAYTASGELDLSSAADVVSVSWYYGVEGQINLSGNIFTSASHYQIESQGGITLDSTAIPRSSVKQPSVNINVEFSGSPTYSRSVSFVDVGSPVNLSGFINLSSNRWAYVLDGGLQLGAEARTVSRNYHFLSSGELNLGGLAKNHWRYRGTEGITFGASSNYTASLRSLSQGGLLLSGNSIVESSPSWHWTASGEIVFTEFAEYSYISLGLLEIEIDSGSELLFIEPIYPYFETTTLSSDLRNITSNCGCDPTPNRLKLSHNLNSCYVLGNFLTRNNLSLSKQINLIYNDNDNTWRASLHFRGIGSNTSERWAVLLEWGCSDEIGSFALGEQIWRFSLLAKRTLTTGTAETRVLFTFPINAVCSDDRIAFSFSINTNTRTVASPVGIISRDTLIYDEIGLFVGKAWDKNPILKINVFEANLPQSSPTIDITPMLT